MLRKVGGSRKVDGLCARFRTQGGCRDWSGCVGGGAAMMLVSIAVTGREGLAVTELGLVSERVGGAALEHRKLGR